MLDSTMTLKQIKSHHLYKSIKGRSKMKKAQLIKAINDLIAHGPVKKAVRKSRKAVRKSRKTVRKSRKTVQKSRKTVQKSRKTARKSRKTTRKSSPKTRKSVRKSMKSSPKSGKVDKEIVSYINKLSKEIERLQKGVDRKTDVISQAEAELSQALSMANPGLRMQQDIAYNESLIVDATKSRDELLSKMNVELQKLEKVTQIIDNLNRAVLSLSELQKTRFLIRGMPDPIKKILMKQLQTHK